MKPGMDALAKLPLLDQCDPALLARLNEAADLARLGPDEELFSEGEILSEVNILVAGQVGAVHSRPGRNPNLLDVLQPIRPLCLPAALLGLPTPAGARTLTTVRLIVLPVAELQAVLRDVPAICQRFLDYSLQEAQCLAQEIYALKLRSSAQRLAGYLLSLAKEDELSPARFVLPYEKRLLAARIGCSQENLSRAFAALRQIGVETQRGTVILRSIPALREYAKNPGFAA